MIGLPEVLHHLISNRDDRLLLADAIASAEGDASRRDETTDSETSWEEILLAACRELSVTPAGLSRPR